MPASQTASGWRGRWLPIVFWAGVGLAPLAAILLLVGGDGGPVRVAAVLAIMSVVLIGLSVTLRDDAETARTELEDTVYEETDAIREDVREDLVAAARKLHGMMQAEIEALSEQIEALRAQLPEGHAVAPKALRAGSVPPPRAAGSAGVNGASAMDGRGGMDGRGAMDGAGRAVNGHGGMDGAGRTSGAAGNGFGHASAHPPGHAGPRGSYADEPPGPVVERARVAADLGVGHEPERRPPTAPSRPALESRSRWDQLSDDVGAESHRRNHAGPGDQAGFDHPGPGGQPGPGRGHDPLDERTAAWRDSGAARSPGGGGRRRAAEPSGHDGYDGYEEPTLPPAAGSGRRDDPWADLRGDTQPAEVRFGNRGYDDFGHDGGPQLAEVRALRPDPHQSTPAADPLAPGWQDAEHGSYQTRAAGSRRW